MSPDKSLQNLYNTALECQDAAERARFLDEACGTDAALRERVEKLLRAQEEVGAFMAQPSRKPAGFDFNQTRREDIPLMEKPSDKIGRYKLLQQIGEGGCGVVYMADQEEPVRRRVALKVIKLGMDTKQVIARFEAERQALALMDHPNIAKVFDAGATETGRPYFVMELVRGSKITEFCDENKLSTADRLKLFIQVCQAIQHAHQKGIIHRDIKPSNILVTINDGVPVPKVIDFGIAKATAGRLTDQTLFTAFEQFIGTPAYMSPEQAVMTSLDIDTRSDIYSLGVLLYELLTGGPPFDQKELLAAGLDGMRRIIREKEPARPSNRLSTMSAGALTTTAQHRHTESPKLLHLVRGDLDWIVMKCLEKDRARRYETVNGLGMDIERHLNCEPVMARPPSRLYKFQKTVRRHKLGFAAAGAVAAALLIGLGVSTWQFLEKSRAYQRATEAEQEQARLRIQAEAEAGKSRQVAQFMKDMLAGVGPTAAMGRDTTMLREILDETAKRVGKDLQEQPEVEAELRSIMGEVYQDLGDYGKAEEMQRAALDIRRKLFGDEHPDVARSLNRLAVVFTSQKRLPEAESHLRKALEMQRRLFPNAHLEIARTINNLGNAIEGQHRLAEAESLLYEALEMQRKLLGSVHPDVASSLGALGIVLRRENKLADALKAQHEGLAIRRELFGNEHPDVAMSLNMVANVLRQIGKLEDAEQSHREALEIRRRVFGAEHPHVAMSLHHLAIGLERQGKMNDAERYYRESLEMRRKLLGFTNSVEAESLESLASILGRQGRKDEVEALFREELSLRKKALGSEHPGVIAAIHYLADFLRKQGKLAEAEVLAREALAMHQQLMGEENMQLALALDALAVVLRDQGKMAEAEAMLRKALAIQRKHGNNEHANSVVKLADLLQAQGKNAQAEALYQEELSSHHNSGGNENPVVTTWRLNLAKLLQAQGRRPEAAILFRQIAEHAGAITLNELAWPMATSPNARDRDGATAVELAEKAVAATKSKNFDIMDTLAAAYAEAGQFTNAVRVQQKAIALATGNKENQKIGAVSRFRLYESNLPYREYGTEASRLQTEGKLDEAEILLRKELDMRRKMCESGDPDLSSSLGNLARLLIDSHKFIEAEPYADECVKLREAAVPDNWLTFNAHSLLGGSLLGQKKHAEAGPLLRSGYEGMKERENKIPAAGKVRLKEALERLVQLYKATGESEKVAEWNKKLAEFNQPEAKK